MNKLRIFGGLKGAVSALAVATLLGGCVSPVAGSKTGLYASPIGNAPVTANPTAYSQALVCLGDSARTRGTIGPRIAVGRILDYTGKVDSDGGRRITQGASLMAISAFAKAGARLVERFDTSVSELELKYANNRLIGDDGASRPINAAQVPGSDYYLVGGITELNYDIRSSGIDGFVGDTGARNTKGTFSGKVFVMNVGLDLRLVSTQTLEVVDVISYQKQIVGREVRAGIFSFWGDTLIDVGAGERALEPIQMAVRAGVERAVVEMMANLYGVQNSTECAEQLKAGGDPMGSGSVTGNYRTADPRMAAQGANRAAPNAWHAKRDDALRGRLEVAQPVENTPKHPARSPSVAEDLAVPADLAEPRAPAKAQAPKAEPKREARVTTTRTAVR